MDVAVPGRRGGAAVVFLFFLSLYLLTASGHIESVDGNVMFGVTANLVRSGDLHTHSPYGLTLSLVAIPFYLGGSLATHLLHFSGDFPIKAVVSLTNALVTALTCALLVVLAQHLAVGRRASLVLALVYGTCTLAWPYAKTFFSEPLVALLLLVAFWALLHLREESAVVRGRRAGTAPGWAAVAAAALGLAVLTRETTVIVLPVFAWYMVAVTRGHPARRRLILVGGLTLAVCLALVAAWNTERFGSLTATGYTGRLWTLAVWPGLYGLLIGPYKGLLVYVPLTFVAIAGWPRFYRAWPREALLCAGTFVIYLVVHAAYIDWPGGGNWGPRFLVPALPFLLLAVPFVWTRSATWTAATVILCLLSLLVQLPAVYVSYARYYPLVGTRDDRVLPALVDRRLSLAPIVQQWQSVPVVTAHVRTALPTAQSDLAQKLSGQVASAMPLNQVLRRSVTVNVPDFWYVYLALSGHLTRAVQLVVAVLAAACLACGLALLRSLRVADSPIHGVGGASPRSRWGTLP